MYTITRKFAEKGEPISFTVGLQELDSKIGEFVAIYSLTGKVEVSRNHADAYTEGGLFVSSIDWKINT